MPEPAKTKAVVSGVRLFVVCALFLPQFQGIAQSGIELFPDNRLYPTYRADALAHQLSISKITDNREWIGAIGGDLPLVSYSGKKYDVQGVIGASIFNRLIKTPGHVIVSTVDYRVDFNLDFSYESVPFRIGWGHVSSHYADDGIEILGAHSINFLRDYLQLGVAHSVGILGGTPYVHLTYAYHRQPLPDRPWIFQFGSDFGNVALASWAVFYGAVDIKLKEEVRWGSTQSYQLGFLLFPREGTDLRLAFTYRTGYEERGQLFDRTSSNSLISLSIDH